MKILEKVDILNKVQLKKKSVEVIIGKVKYNKNSFDGKILGRTLYDWVAFACNGRNVRVIDITSKDNILQFVKNYINNNFDYTLFLLSSTPLITKQDIDSVIEYAFFKDINLCKLPTGYIFKNKYLSECKDKFVDSVYSQNIDNFYIVESKKQFSFALNILQERINNFHIENGVEIIKPSSVYIEPEVDIESGSIIYPNNSLKGTTIIGNDVILKENNVIENTIINSGCCISGSNITNSKMGNHTYISSFCEIDNSIIGDECIVENYCVIKNTKIKNKSKIKSRECLGESNDSNSGAR